MMSKTDRLSQLCAVFALQIGIVSASDTEAKITPDPEGLTVEHQGVPVRVQREQNETQVMFCNGAWCGQSPTNIRSLTRMGYPPSKIKWYLGGMQAWETLGLTTVVAESQ
jgi:hypothetical protein